MNRAGPPTYVQAQKRRASQQEEFARLKLEGMGPLGDTYAYLDGKEINVFGGLPGEEVVARVVRYTRRRKERASAIVTEVLSPSPHRVEPPCPYFGPCSGCQWQHIQYSHQLELKRKAIEDQLRLFDNLKSVSVSDTIPCSQPFDYRNHARFMVKAGGTPGFVNRITRRFVEIDRCMLMHPWINNALSRLKARCKETTQLAIRYGVNTGDYLIQPRLENTEVPLSTGQTHYRERLLDHTFNIASPSFFQVNTTQAETLTLLIRDRLELTGIETLVDAYAGVGTFSALLAPYVRQVTAIEESAAAVQDAAANTQDLDNVEFRQGKTEEVLDTLDQTPDVVILDPPGRGCHPGALGSLIRLMPKKVVYVSCNAEALARDLDILVRGGYRVDSVEPVDMFPQTHHVECVANLVADGRPEASGNNVKWDGKQVNYAEEPGRPAG